MTLTLIVFNLALIFSLTKLARLINLMDIPVGRKTHASATPLIGGLAIYFTLLAAIAINNDWGSDVGMIICWASAVVLIGFIDDIKNVRWPIRLYVQVIAALGVIITTGIKVTYLGTYPIIGPVELGHLSAAFTVFAVVGLTNAFNLIDGIDGLCGSLLLLPLSTLMGIGYWVSGNVDFYTYILGALLAVFLSFNLSPNPKHKIFMGDAGSAGLGFIVSFIAIIYINDENLSLAPPFALWLFLVPIIDTIHVIIKRAVKGKSIFHPGLDHLHHSMMAVGYSRRKILAFLLLATLLGVVGGIFLYPAYDTVSLLGFLIILAFLPSIFFALKK